MTFDPLKFYEDGKRRESLWGAVTPFILVGLLLLVMGVNGYLGYKSVKPKHTLGSPAIISYTKLAADPPSKWGHECRKSETWTCGDPSLKVWDTTNAGFSPYRTSDAFEVTRPRKRKYRRKADVFHITAWTPAALTPETLPPTRYMFDDCAIVSRASIGRDCSDIIATCGGHEVQLIWREKVVGAMNPPESPLGTTPVGTLTVVTADANGVLWSADGSHTCFAGAVCPVPTASDIEAHKAKKPPCVMPADIDVCPVQMLEPKAADDKKVKP